MVCKALRDFGVTAPIDVHLMVEPVDALIGMFADAGASVISFHPDASTHVDRSLQMIRMGCQAGLVFNPPRARCAQVRHGQGRLGTIDVGESWLRRSVLHSATLGKCRETRAMIDESGLPIRLEVDGGVSAANIRDIAEAGTDTFVAGSAIFNQQDYRDVIDKMRAELELSSHA